MCSLRALYLIFGRFVQAVPTATFSSAYEQRYGEPLLILWPEAAASAFGAAMSVTCTTMGAHADQEGRDRCPERFSRNPTWANATPVLGDPGATQCTRRLSNVERTGHGVELEKMTISRRALARQEERNQHAGRCRRVWCTVTDFGQERWVNRTATRGHHWRKGNTLPTHNSVCFRLGHTAAPHCR